ncbi:DASS family sodium-coupled anion symporter [Fulvimarina endophytica]|uniref:DASS family sodium-coupled anion symporter n=1 Tax=Fulvimarina endophytica TaxID=2293836 RepID=A0A371X0C5_9HYPH|nr:DASS family sodium-coupled anion symporter [Fulvimarina endophytica]RFC62659.1 DASS family sodium-coupled anion symporter [Fulvimarina endophytica]
MAKGHEAPAAQGAPQEGKAVAERPFSVIGLIGLVAGPLVAFAFFMTEPRIAVSAPAWSMIGFTLWMVIWWLTEAVPIPITSLLPLPVMPLVGLLPMDEVAPSYSDPLILLFLGGFILAGGLEQVGLHRRIAINIVHRIGTTPNLIVLGFMLASAFLSMWISNVATTIMMFAVAMSVIGFISERTGDERITRNFGVALLLAVAYAASIGGVGTIIGSIPNGLMVSFLRNNHGIEIGFFDWMLLGIPIVALMIPIVWLILTRLLFPAAMDGVEGLGAVIEREYCALGRWSRGEVVVACVFGAAATLWVLRPAINAQFGLGVSDTMIAIFAAIMIFVVPTRLSRGERASDAFAVNWQVSRKVPWGVLLLFGGGLALAAGFAATGLADAIGTAVSGLPVPTYVLVLVALASVMLLTEVTSNTATTATFLPILGAVAVGLGLPAVTLAIPVAIAASMAFMMPVATPPNAIVFAYDKMRLADMVHAGALVNLTGIAVSYILILLLAPSLFGATIFDR